jgi:anti-anti-sigma regulatory factor
MSSQTEKLATRKIVMLEGGLTVRRAEEIKADFLNAVKYGDEITVTFGNISDVDLSCLQVFCSAHRSAIRAHKQIRFGNEFPAILKNMATGAGLFRLRGCKMDCGKSCLWTAAAGAYHE